MSSHRNGQSFGIYCLKKMEEYLTNRIKALEDIEIEALANSDWELATKVNFAKCELMDAKNEYRKIQLTIQL